jgi:predicted AAA+ superfamily ATPase
MIQRVQQQNIDPFLFRGKAIIIIGPRQVGKTTLTQELLSKSNRPVLWLSGDDPGVRALLQDITLAQLKTVVGSYEVVVVDEAQRIRNAGIMLKLITDHFPGVQLMVTGSSVIDLAAETKESLVGRKFEFPLYPVSFAEMVREHGYVQERSLLTHRLVYGYYPEVVQSSPQLATRLLNDLTDGLMYKDLLSLDQIKKPSILVKLLQALALQVGSEVSYHELGQLIGIDPATVERYIDLLEQSFVIFRLTSLSRNARNEIKKGKKVYFYDNGIRNAIIKNFSPIDLRMDKGALWENFLITERRKRNVYTDYYCNHYFWRTFAQQEIDLVEEADGRLTAYEFKWNPKKKVRFSKTFLDAYPGSETQVVHPDNFYTFLQME